MRFLFTIFRIILQKGVFMKKIIKLSLATCLGLSGLVYADSLEEALKNSQFNAIIKGEYSNSNFLGQPKSDDIGVLGGGISAQTGSFYGFKLGATFQASFVIGDDDNSRVFASDLDASGASLPEIYLNYTYSKTSLKVGRQFIYTPLVSSAVDGKSSESVVKDSFEAYLLSTKDLLNTTLVLGYINKYQPKTDGNGDEGEFDEYKDGAYTFFIKNNSIENLTLQAQYLHENGQTSSADIDAFYFQADYKLGSHTLSAQYLHSKDKSRATNQNGELFGLMATGGLGIGKLGYLVAYNASTEDGDVYLGAGSGTQDTPFTAMPVNGGGVPSRGDTDTIVGGVVIPFAGVVAIPYVGKSFSNSHPIGDVTAFGAMAMYSYKDVSLKLAFEHVEVQKVIAKDTNVARFYINYKF